MSYEPPIEIISNMVTDLACKIAEEHDHQIVATIREQYHVECDREELIKALNYDRRQYEKGYEDARRTFSASLPLHDAVYNYLLSHEVSEVLEVVLEAIKDYER